MLKLYGKYVARWTGADGKRHSKACETAKEAKKLQAKMIHERQTKKARPRARRSATSPVSGQGQTKAEKQS
jgi:hypothetical protein